MYATLSLVASGCPPQWSIHCPSKDSSYGVEPIIYTPDDFLWFDCHISPNQQIFGFALAPDEATSPRLPVVECLFLLAGIVF